MKKSKPRPANQVRRSGHHQRTEFEQYKDHEEKVPKRGTKSLTAIERARLSRS